MGNRKSLGRLITKYAILEIIYTFFILLISYIISTLLIYNGYVYPANFAEHNISRVEDVFYGDDFETSKIPYYYDYIYKVDGKIKKYTINEKDRDEVREAIKEQTNMTSSLFDPIYITVLENNRETLILTYRVKPILSNSDLYRSFPNIETPYIVITLAIWLIGFMLIVRKSIRIIRREIDKITQTNMEIKNKNLDYRRKASAYAEINEVLDSIDQMAGDLRESLREQWQIENKQKNLIESITHDIRTPITLIKGNTELLKEESNPSQLEYINDLENGIGRLEIYIKKLNNFSKSMVYNPQIIDKNVINYWIELASTITSNEKINLIVINKDTTDVKLNKEDIASALQNIIINACEHSPRGSTIYLSFNDKYDFYTISVKDNGEGFRKEILDKGPKKNLTTKPDKINHGLGLIIVDDLLKNNNGELVIGNYKEDNRSGGKVKMIFKK